MQYVADAYNGEFQGMTGVEMTLEELEQVQKTLAPSVLASLDASERRFLISMKEGEPEWDLLGIDNLERMPALQWKLLNIRKMDAGKRASALERLQGILNV